ncbi:short chain dehydrogenase [Hyphomonas adhaerens MHS-3]|uniref:Short chain dehydrogenase n=1 Tax=Hyphomonas adhaerens MHS-3 TaxID=1280949 RepID=A0A069E7R0_9PROT|nr:short-chain dehydrogenase/reductase [Hyphomonas adhaerens]KCZ86138.1 short chain dehydrogenase [Hyphomonas adhaerens MHS-3]
MDLELQGKRVLITGGSKGIGLATAEAFAREGANLILVSRTEKDLAAAQISLSSTYGNHVQIICTNLSEPGGIASLTEAAHDVDILVNNAGAIPPGSLLDTELETWRHAWNLKVFGYIELTRSLYPHLTAPGGVIINIIGSAGENPNKDYICGSTGNAALMMFTQAFAQQARTNGIRVVGVNPGPVLTDRFRMLLQAEAKRRYTDPSRWEELMQDLPFGRAAAPAEVADAIAFLASRRSAYTTGTIVTIDGGHQ